MSNLTRTEHARVRHLFSMAARLEADRRKVGRSSGATRVIRSLRKVGAQASDEYLDEIEAIIRRAELRGAQSSASARNDRFAAGLNGAASSGMTIVAGTPSSGAA